MNDKRITELDSVRGMAAFTVLLHHCLMVLPLMHTLFFTLNPAYAHGFTRIVVFSPLHIFWNGHSAVMLFFVLSGFVLSISYYDNSRYNYMGYIVKRFFRLYVPCFVVITVSALLLNYWHTDHGIAAFSPWFNSMWTHKVSVAEYMQLLLFHGDIHNVCTTLWTIIVEIKISFILPFFFAMISRLSFARNMIFIAVYTAIYQYLAVKNILGAVPFFRDFYFLPFFLMGGLIYKYKDHIAGFVFLRKYALLLLLVVAPVLYNWEWVFAWVSSHQKDHYYYSFINDYMVAAASCLIIMICVLHIPSVRKILNHASFIFLGRISYSLYLIHPVILLAVIYTTRQLPYMYVIPIIIVAVIAVSYIYYLLVEEPSVRLGRYMARLTRRK